MYAHIKKFALLGLLSVAYYLVVVNYIHTAQDLLLVPFIFGIITWALMAGDLFVQLMFLILMPVVPIILVLGKYPGETFPVSLFVLGSMLPYFIGAASAEGAKKLFYISMRRFGCRDN